jgi:hypothetical protein
MFLQVSEAQQRVLSDRNIAAKVAKQIVLEERGLSLNPFRLGRTGAPEIPNELKPVIGAIARLTSSREAEEEFGVNHTSAAEYAQEDFGKKAGDAKGKVEDEIAPVRKLALSRVSSALSCITEEKLQDNSAKTLSEIARNLSSVIRNSMPQDKNDDGQKYNFVVFTPKVREMKQYEGVEVAEAVIVED